MVILHFPSLRKWTEIVEGKDILNKALGWSSSAQPCPSYVPCAGFSGRQVKDSSGVLCLFFRNLIGFQNEGERRFLDHILLGLSAQAQALPGRVCFLSDILSLCLSSQSCRRQESVCSVCRSSGGRLALSLQPHFPASLPLSKKKSCQEGVGRPPGRAAVPLSQAACSWLGRQ